MTIQILGSGCPNCQKLEENARAAAAELGLEADFQKVTNMDEILEMGVMRTPGLAIDGTVVRFGKVYSPQQIAEAIQEYQAP